MTLIKHDRRDTDFMSELEAATHMRPATPAVIMLFTIVALVFFLFIWAGVSKVEELTRGQGSVVPTTEIQVVQSLEGGVLQDILVREGESVKKGQILLRLSDVQFSSKERGTEAKFAGLKAKKARLTAEIEGRDFDAPAELEENYPAIVVNERSLYESRQKELQGSYSILDDKISQATAEISEASANIKRLEDSAGLLQQELTITSEMVKKRAVPKLEEIRLQRELSDVKGSVAAENEKRKGLEAERRAARNERANLADRFRSEALTELSKVETEMAELKEDLTSLSDRVDRTEIRSPVDGVVNRVAVNTVGGVVEPAQPLAEIVPLGDEIKIVVKVSPDEIGFLRLGQNAKVKLTAYDVQKYGALDARVTRIGANSITDPDGNIYFEVEVKTDKNYLGTEENPLPVMPGMLAQVEVITGKRTILDYLLKPILKATDRAFTER
jgi:adhesin transport system membrane fusion protein